jgi:putative intracellular protease/amidase
MGKKVVVLASNVGLWAEELQAPWDALKKAGHELTLATKQGKKPLPITVSMDADFMDPMQHYQVNPLEVVNRTKELLNGEEWAHPIKFDEIDMSKFDAIVLVGGPGSALDMVGNIRIHQLILEAYEAQKIIGGLCYAIGALALTRNPKNKNKSVIFGRTVVAHPHAWDFYMDMGYPLYGATPDNKGTDLVTAGFLFPLQYLTEDAVGPDGKVIADETANREKPCVAYDHPFVTGLSVESSIAYGKKLVEVLG